jgi:D-glycero-D-manno-heptose 1,7-bisphosphate phosphatase
VGKHAVKSEVRSLKSEVRRAVFLDRDGVINRALERDGLPHSPASLDEFEILPGVAATCAKLKQAGYLLIVATNQPDVGRGALKREIVEMIHVEMCRQLPVDRVEVCYHPGKGQSDCDCRKPKPGMLLRAARELGIDLAQSWMVGDRWRDIDCGHAAGCRTIFIDRGYAEVLRQKPHFSAGNLAEAADIILRESKKH